MLCKAASEVGSCRESSFLQGTTWHAVSHTQHIIDAVRQRKYTSPTHTQHLYICSPSIQTRCHEANCKSSHCDGAVTHGNSVPTCFAKQRARWGPAGSEPFLQGTTWHAVLHTQHIIDALRHRGCTYQLTHRVCTSVCPAYKQGTSRPIAIGHKPQTWQ
jgi:uncharacterized protein (DUF779 family)